MIPRRWALTHLLAFFAERPAQRAEGYSWIQRTVGADRVWRRLVGDVLCPTPGQRILDVGCGPADILHFLPNDVDYLGTEPHEPYRKAAQQRHGHRALFSPQRVEDLEAPQGFDTILFIGVLHHLPDPAARSALHAAGRLLRPNGRVVALDPCPRPNRGALENQLYAIDRGDHVRPAAANLALFDGSGLRATGQVWEGMLRLPYTYLLIQAISA